MTTTSTKFVVAEESEILATRAAGAELRKALLDRLQESAHITIDFHNVPITPSFADEFLGVTISILGRDEFRQRVAMVNVSESAKVLIRHVLNDRVRSSTPSGRFASSHHQ